MGRNISSSHLVAEGKKYGWGLLLWVGMCCFHPLRAKLCLHMLGFSLKVSLGPALSITCLVVYWGSSLANVIMERSYCFLSHVNFFIIYNYFPFGLKFDFEIIIIIMVQEIKMFCNGSRCENVFLREMWIWHMVLFLLKTPAVNWWLYFWWFP